MTPKDTVEGWETRFTKKFFVTNLATGTHVGAHEDAIAFIQTELDLTLTKERERIIHEVRRVLAYEGVLSMSVEKELQTLSDAQKRITDNEV